MTLGACATGNGERSMPVGSAGAGTVIPADAATLWRDAGWGAGGADAGGIVGLDGPALERLLGNPVLVRRDAPAEVWQYRAADCVLDLFLYQETDAPVPRVLYVEARTGAAEPAPIERCVGSLLAGRRSLQSS